MSDRAIVFIDGNNWYHALSEAGVPHLGGLNYKRISEKLLGPRVWVGTRYYIGAMTQQISTALYAQQRHFLASLTATDPRISIHLGRLELKPAKSAAAQELRAYLSSPPVRIEPRVFHDLVEIAKRHATVPVQVEKAVDVMLALDMVTLALKDEYDAAYLLSADGDFTPAVEAVRALVGKKVYAASPQTGAQLAKAVSKFIPLAPAWFTDCY